MMNGRSRVKPAVFVLLTFMLLFGSVFQGVDAQATEQQRVLVFVSDGMRHDLMKQFASEGLMPTYKNLLDTGVTSEHGMIPNVPPNTGPSWTALATGASPAVSGVTNNTFHNNTQSFANPSYFGTSAWTAGVNQAETLMEKAEASGLSVAVLGWQAFDPATITSVWVVESYPDWLTTRGIIANYAVPLTWTALLGPPNPTLSFTQVTLADAAGWTNVPVSFSPAKQTSFTQVDWLAAPVLTYNVYIYDSTDDSTVNYDQVLLDEAKDGATPAAALGAGEWSDEIKVNVAGQDGGFYVKAIDLSADLSQFRMYFTPVTRLRAYPQTLEDELVGMFPAMMPFDFSPYLLGLVDAQTFFEQESQPQMVLGDVFAHIITTKDPDVAFVGNEGTDAMQHRFLSRALPDSPTYDAVNGPTYWGYIEQSYANADAMLKKVSDAMPDAAVFVTSDHGFSPTGKAVNAGLVLQNAGLYDPANRGSSQAVAYGAGGTLQVYINLVGRNPDGVVPAADYAAVQQEIVAAFDALGPDLVERIVLKEDADAIETVGGMTYNLLNENTTGDVLVFLKPPYQFDAPTPGQVSADTPIYGQHGYIPNGDPDRYAVFAAGGGNIVPGLPLEGISVLDLAPTVASLLGIDPPAQSEGFAYDLTMARQFLPVISLRRPINMVTPAP